MFSQKTKTPARNADPFSTAFLKSCFPKNQQPLLVYWPLFTVYSRPPGACNYPNMTVCSQVLVLLRDTASLVRRARLEEVSRLAHGNTALRRATLTRTPRPFSGHVFPPKTTAPARNADANTTACFRSCFSGKTKKLLGTPIRTPRVFSSHVFPQKTAPARDADPNTTAYCKSCIARKHKPLHLHMDPE